MERHPAVATAAGQATERHQEVAVETQPQGGCSSAAQGTTGTGELLQVVRLGRLAAQLLEQEGCPLQRVAEVLLPWAGWQLLLAEVMGWRLGGWRPLVAGESRLSLLVATAEAVTGPPVAGVGCLSTVRPLWWCCLAASCRSLQQARRVAAGPQAAPPLRPVCLGRELRRSAQTAAAARRQRCSV